MDAEFEAESGPEVENAEGRFADGSLLPFSDGPKSAMGFMADDW